jgi:hypothetical protein
MLDKLKGFKTIAFNVLMGATMLIRFFNPETQVPDVEEVTAAVDAVGASLTAIWGFGNMWLRAITDSPIFKKT